MRPIVCLLLLLALNISTPGCGEVPAAQAASSSTLPGFTSTSRVVDEGNGNFYIGAEALMPSGFSKTDLPFTLPANATVARFQATVSWNAPCQADALAILIVNNQRYAPVILKTLAGAQSMMVLYDLPFPTGDGSAVLHVEGNPVCSGPYAGQYSSFEIQGMLQVQ